MRKVLIGVCGGIALGLSATAALAYLPDSIGGSGVFDTEPEMALSGDWLNPVTVALRDRITHRAKVNDAKLEKDRQAVADDYAARGYAPLWVDNGHLSAGAQKIIARLAQADLDGLDSRAYPTPPADLGATTPATPQALADADIQLSQSVVLYARQAMIGRIDPQALNNPNIGYTPVPPDAAQTLLAVHDAADPATALESYNPTHEGFVRLRQQLVAVRAAGVASHLPQIPAGKTLKPGANDDRVPLLRARFGLPALTDKPQLFDEATVAAVKAFQQSHGVTADGAVGPGTLSAMNAAAVDPASEIIANLERWRWLPRDLGRFYVQVNIPEFMLAIHRDGKITHTTRVVVGQPDKQTPVFSDEIEYIIVNPSWYVPDSIAVKEMLPAIQSNPGAYFARNNYVVTTTINGREQVVDPNRVDWRSINPRYLHFRQPPGDNNALGNIKFMFPNQYSVYLHDTPSKALFNQDVRDFSHGCVRVMDPFGFAQALLVDDPQWDAAKIKKLIGTGEKQLNLAAHIPVHLTYFTAWVDDAGKLQTRKDIYGISAAVQKALGLNQPSV